MPPAVRRARIEVCGYGRVRCAARGRARISTQSRRLGVAALLLLHSGMLLRATDSGVIDPSVIETIRALSVPGKPHVLVDIVQLFLADAPGQLAMLSTAVDAGDADAAWPIAHRLRNRALELGAIRMAPLCSAIELAAHSGSVEHAGPRVETLMHEFGMARAALERAIQ
jgi:HPt (histidine-containing phosphotransfer) domain-containing protein